MSDIVDMAYRMRSVSPMPKIPVVLKEKNESARKSSVPYYMRITAKDTPGVLSKVSGVLAEYSISIISVMTERA